MTLCRCWLFLLVLGSPMHLAFFDGAFDLSSYRMRIVMIHAFCSKKSHKPLNTSTNYCKYWAHFFALAQWTSWVIVVKLDTMVHYGKASYYNGISDIEQRSVSRTFERHFAQKQVDRMIRAFFFIFVAVVDTDKSICSNNHWTRSVTLYRFFSLLLRFALLCFALLDVTVAA